MFVTLRIPPNLNAVYMLAWTIPPSCVRYDVPGMAAHSRICATTISDNAATAMISSADGLGRRWNTACRPVAASRIGMAGKQGGAGMSRTSFDSKRKVAAKRDRCEFYAAGCDDAARLSVGHRTLGT